MKRALVVRGRMSDPRHIELDEPVTEIHGPVEVTVQAAPAREAGGGGHSLSKVIDEIRARVPSAEWEKLPRDAAANIDHYLYGAPKADGDRG